MSDQSRIEDRLERVEAILQRMDVTLAAQHVSLENHIRRTELLEESVRPIEKHVAVVGAIGKILLGSGGVLSIIGLGIQIYRLFAEL